MKRLNYTNIKHDNKLNNIIECKLRYGILNSSRKN